jgi:hypothetical protein
MLLNHLHPSATSLLVQLVPPLYQEMSCQSEAVAGKFIQISESFNQCLMTAKFQQGLWREALLGTELKSG